MPRRARGEPPAPAPLPALPPRARFSGGGEAASQGERGVKDQGLSVQASPPPSTYHDSARARALPKAREAGGEPRHDHERGRGGAGGGAEAESHATVGRRESRDHADSHERQPPAPPTRSSRRGLAGCPRTPTPTAHGARSADATPRQTAREPGKSRRVTDTRQSPSAHHSLVSLTDTVLQYGRLRVGDAHIPIEALRSCGHGACNCLLTPPLKLQRGRRRRWPIEA